MKKLTKDQKMFKRAQEYKKKLKEIENSSIILKKSENKKRDFVL